jgi:3-methyl-2-oxobutanoate hydroxymethyltransferase
VSPEKLTIRDLRKMKKRGEKITLLTAYDYPMATLVDRAGIDMILVGDSLAMTVLGHESTLPVTMDEMISHARAVTRAVKRAFVVGDMPYLSYQVSDEDAIRNAGRFMQEALTDAVKVEGGEHVCGRVKAIVESGIPVMGHLGLTPQSLSLLGGYRVQAKTARAARKLIGEARMLEDVGVFCIVLECIPSEVGKAITDAVSVPTLGVGAGPHCDGQILVMHDMLGLFEFFSPKFAKQYANLTETITAAFEAFRHEVKARQFPGPEHCYAMKPEEAERLSAGPASEQDTAERDS